jgi:hypothetical protein
VRLPAPARTRRCQQRAGTDHQRHQNRLHICIYISTESGAGKTGSDSHAVRTSARTNRTATKQFAR